MKTKIFGAILIFALSSTVFAQSKNYSMIYIYRTGVLTSLYDYPVVFNNVIVHKMPWHNKLAYKIYSQGKLNIELAGNVKINLNIEHGKDYYIKSPNTGVSKLVPEEVGKKEFNSERNRPDLYTEMEEDISNPLIRDNKNNYTVLEKNLTEEKQVYLPSDIDINIPVSSKKNEYRYALIIGNEDYNSFQQGLDNESNVDYALNDARIIKEYAIKTFGIPEDNIIYLENAKAVEMSRSINTLKTIIKNSNGKAEVLFYYAGHGYPEESTNEPFIIPVDVSGKDLQFAVKLYDLYTQLNEYPSEKITVILDACFSGGGRNAGLLSARGVKVKPKENLLNGNIVVFTASSGVQSSLSYKDKNHGLFTYFLLKIIQETEGDITYKELSDYLSEQVSIRSALVNQKEQNPQTLISNSVKDSWYNWKIK